MLRDARHDFRSNIHKYYACIASRVLTSRHTPHVTISEVELATQKAKGLPSVSAATNANSHKLKKEFQNMMKWKSGQHWWQSTSAQSLIDQVIAMEWLLSLKAPSNQQDQIDASKYPKPTLSCLVIASTKLGKRFLVLTSSRGFCC